jgi:acetyl-CoA C-acetyltransferase
MSNKFNEVVIISAARTPIGAYKGSLKDIKADQLGSLVIKEVINRSGIDKKKLVR